MDPENQGSAEAVAENSPGMEDNEVVNSPGMEDKEVVNSPGMEDREVINSPGMEDQDVVIFSRESDLPVGTKKRTCKLSVVWPNNKTSDISQGHPNGPRGQLPVSSSTPRERPRMVSTRRQCYTQNQVEEAYQLDTASPSVWDRLKDQCRCSAGCVKNRVLRTVPIVNVLRNYRYPDAVGDMVSGLSVGFLHLPQGLGFGLLASLKPVYGLYSSFFPVLVYMLFGTSPHVSMGTNAVIALLTAAPVDREAEIFRHSRGGNQTVSDEEMLQYKVGVATALCFMEGFILIGMGFFRLGFLTNFMSKSFIGGFSFAAAVHITVSQVVKLLHLNLPSRAGFGKLVYTTIDVCKYITDTNVGDVVVGLVCGVVLMAVKIGINERYKHKLKIPIPVELIVVVLSTLISHLANFEERFGIDVVGDIPRGMPAPILPPFEIIPKILSDAFITAILIFALTISMAKLTAKLHVIDIDDNQELVAYGLCQLVGSFFQNFSSMISPPRAMMLSSLGSKTTLNAVPSAMFILLVLLLMGQLFVSLPIPMLAAMIIVAMKDILLQVSCLKTLWYVNKCDFFIWVLTAVFSIFGDLDIGLLVGVVFSMVTVMAVSQMSKGTLMGRSYNEDIIMDLDRRGISPIPDVQIFRFESQLHFASAERFKAEMYSKIFDPTTSSHKDCYEISVDPSSSFARTPIPTLDQKPDSKDGVVVALESSNLSSSENLGKKDLSNPVIEADDNDQKDPDPCEAATEDDPMLSQQTNNSAADPVEAFRRPEAPRHVIVDCSTMTYIDMSGVDMLHLIITQFARAGVAILLTDIPPTTLGILTRAKFFEHEDNRKIYFSVIDALESISVTPHREGFRKSFA